METIYFSFPEDLKQATIQKVNERLAETEMFEGRLKARSIRISVEGILDYRMNDGEIKSFWLQMD